MKATTALILGMLWLASPPRICAAQPPRVEPLIGYTEFQTDLPGGRHANVRTMRAVVARANGAERRLLAEQLADKTDSWTQFAGWSADGQQAIISRGWQDPENARWEEDHQAFRMQSGKWSLDAYLLDMSTDKLMDVTAVDRVSHYNGGLFFWPKDPTKLGFTALIDGNSHPFRMDRDGHNKVDLTKDSQEFSYGFSSSPDGRRIAYHKSYQVCLAEADGSAAVAVQTGHAFNFAPTWSPDGQWVLFVAGEHYNCHPYIVGADGAGLRKLADRGGYRGVIEILDVPDFHGGSSDTPVWSSDGESIFYTAQVGASVELFRVSLEGQSQQLTKAGHGAQHYHPQPSLDGTRLLYGSKRNGVRNLYVMQLESRSEQRITELKAGRAAMWGHWQPSQ